ncbi:MAG: hypothetical protein ABMA64_30485, partial [Myxococcota bacterium]
MNVPEGVQTVTVEGGDLKNAIGQAAQQLGLHPAQVDYKLDLSHFRTASGASVARSTVRIVAWGSDRDAPSDGAGARLDAGIVRGADGGRPADDGDRPPRSDRGGDRGG